MKHCLGIDAGGSKTDVALYDGQTLVFEAKIQGFQLHNMNGTQHMVEQIHTLLDKQAIGSLDYLIAGFAGLDDEADFQTAVEAIRPLQTRYTIKQTIICPDILLALLAGTREIPSACMVSGTGANTIALHADGTVVKTGNWGYLIGDQASGYYLGKRLIEEAVKELDHRLPSSGLDQLVLHFFGVTSLPDLSQALYHHPEPVAAIASITKVFSKVPWAQHPKVKEHLSMILDEMMLSLTVIAKQLQSEAGDIPVVLSGNVFKLEEQITNPLTERITHTWPWFIPIVLTQKPVTGVLELKHMSEAGVLPKLARRM
jgi:N-acetylglucosamine kinase-like BadF-type ATPase